MIFSIFLQKFLTIYGDLGTKSSFLGIVGSEEGVYFCSRKKIQSNMSNRLFSKIFSNARKPEGFFGRMMVNGMNGGSHARMAQWGLSFVNINENASVLYYTEDELITEVLAYYPLSEGVVPRGLQSRLMTFLEDTFSSTTHE